MSACFQPQQLQMTLTCCTFFWGVLELFFPRYSFHCTHLLLKGNEVCLRISYFPSEIIPYDILNLYSIKILI